jgi:WD40 repeat protein
MEDPSLPPAANDLGPNLQIQQDLKGNQNQMIGQVLGGMVVYGQVIYNNPSVETDSAAKADAAEIGPNPYKGLLAFQETDGDRFFGRDPQIEGLWEKFQELHEEESATRLLTIYGPSGSGKSSLARAGLIPELARRPLPGRNRARVAVLVPGSNPLEELATVLARIATNDLTPVAKTREFADELKQANAEGVYDGLRRIADAMPEIAISPLIVLVDQLEEVFTLCEDSAERDAFICNLLCAAAERSKRVSAIVTIRSDFLGATQKNPRLNQLIASQGFFVAAMSAEGLREAITKPAEMAGHPLDLSTVDRLIEQTEGREGALPLLQFALTRIWAGLAEGKEPAQTLRAIGGVGGALAGEAQRIYESLPSEEQEIARRIFLGLVQLGEGSKDTRRRTELARVVSHRDSLEQVQKVIARFSAPGARLITLAEDGGTETAEVTHEALFDHWQQMKDWLDGSRSDLRFQRRLDEAAMVWQQNGRPEGNLWRSPDLELLRSFHERAGFDMTPLQVEFFNASADEEESRKLAEKERIRTEKDLAEEKLKAAEVKTTTAWLLTGVMSLGLLLTSGAAIFSAVQAREAEIGQIQASVALSKAMLANSQGLEADIESIRAGKTLKQSIFQAIFPDPRLRMTVLGQLQQTINTGHERNRLEIHQGRITSVIFSHDGKQMSTSGNDGIARIWDASGRQLTEIKDALRSIYSVGFSLDGKQLATIGNDENVNFWGVSGNQLAEIKGDKGQLASIDFSPTSNQLAITRIMPSFSSMQIKANSNVTLWDTSGNRLAELKGLQDNVSDVVFSPNGRKIATIGSENTANLWDISGRKLVELKGHQRLVTSVAFSPNGKQLATSGNDDTIRLWNTAGKQLKLIKGNQGRIRSVIFSPNGKQLATMGITSSSENIVSLWNISGEQLDKIKIQSRVRSVAFSPDGRQLAISGDDDIARLWDTANHHLAELKGHHGRLKSAVFILNGKQLVTSGEDGIVRLWDTSDNYLTELKGHQGRFTTPVFSPNGEQLATIGEDGRARVRLWSTSGKQLAELKSHPESIDSVAFSPDGKKLVTSGDYGKARLWNTSGNQLAEFKGHHGWVKNVVFSPDGKQLATSGGDDTVNLWDIYGNQQGTIKTQQEITNLAFSSNGKSLATSGNNGIVYLWNTFGKKIDTIKVNQKDIADMLFSPDGKYLAISGEVDNTPSWWGRIVTVTLWNISSKQKTEIDNQHKNLINGVAFSPDSKQLATSGSDDIARLWNISGKQLAEFKGHQGRVNNVVFSPDGKQLATSGDDGMARLWDTSGRQLAEIQGNQGSITSVVFTPDGKQLATSGDNGTTRLWQVGGMSDLLVRNCDRIRNYLKNKIAETDRNLCDGIER